MSDTPPDRLSVNPDSPHYDAAALERGVGVRFKGVEKTNVDEYCVSEGWVRLAAGNAGVIAAVNDEVEKSELPMMLYVYGAIVLLVFAVYRDWRAIIACCLPLTVATFIGYAFMKQLQIGLTVATLPVIALGVGVGVGVGKGGIDKVAESEIEPSWAGVWVNEITNPAAYRPGAIGPMAL